MVEINLQKGNYVVLMTPLYNQTKIRGAVAVLRDMTEERRLEKMRQDFIANVSHELVHRWSCSKGIVKQF